MKRAVRMYEVPGEEGDAVAFWFESLDGKFVASIVAGEPWKREHDYDVRGRLRTPKGFLREIAFVGALFSNLAGKKQSYMGSIERSYKNQGWNVKLISSGEKEWKQLYTYEKR